jgi:SAM-dependent methyltransferase
MNSFGAYSKYYNLLYHDKDYPGEVAYICTLINKYQPKAKKILDLGCGSGCHDLLLAERGYSVSGVDLSSEMLSQASQNLINNNPEFIHGDIRRICLEHTFDVVISLFHVISYQISNDDLFQTFLTAANHLKPDGILIFDCWYGPGVLTERPEVRIKRYRDESLSIIRLAEPEMHINENIVDVNYQLLIQDQTSGKLTKVSEQHRMRYLFKPEVAFFFQQTGFKFIDCFEYSTLNEPHSHSWSVSFLGQKMNP